MSGNNAKWFTRAVAVFLAVIILGGVVLGALQSFAMGPMYTTLSIVNTGQSNTNYWIIIAAVVAIVVLVGAIVLPKLLKKK
ncbi:MAG: hypothetical protein RR069_00035 [Oscillospiraceae bacterium]